VTAEPVVTQGIEWESSANGLSLHSIFAWYRNDPLTVYMNFADVNGPVEWVVGRQLFIDAFKDGQSGEGDCQLVIALEDDVLVMFLKSPFGEAGLKTKAHLVGHFLEQTLRQVSEADENLDSDIDLAISLILEAG
jgi:hypothetical protein